VADRRTDVSASAAAIRLPPIIRWTGNKLMYLLYWAPFIITYQITNRWPPLEPRELPFTSLDRIIPFTPEALPIYVAYIPFYWWTVARARNDREVNWLFYGAYAQLLLSLPFFVLFPVRMQLGQFYGPEPVNWADGLWRWFDAPNNCFPSLHVSNCLLLLQFNWTRAYRWPHTLAALAVIASTLLVKQHYVVDVAGGIAVYIVSRWFLRRLDVTRMSADGWDLRRRRHQP
jgi:hypothetical protein